MTSERSVEGALLLDDVTLKRGRDRFAVLDRQADVAGDQVIKALFDLRLELVASRDFVRTLSTDFPAYPASPLPRLAESRARIGTQCTLRN